MTYPFTPNATRTPAAVPNRMIARARPLLDVTLSGALWKDRRVPVAAKAAAAALGVLTVALLIAVQWAYAPDLTPLHATFGASLRSLLLSSAGALFSSLGLLWMAPAKVVNLVRLERGGAIPLRVDRKQGIGRRTAK